MPECQNDMMKSPVVHRGFVLTSQGGGGGRGGEAKRLQCIAPFSPLFLYL